MGSRASRKETGDAFEERVAELYRLLGYHIERDITVAGQQVDLVAAAAIPGAPPLRMIVECKGGKRTRVGNDVVNDVQATLHRGRAHGFTSATIVTEGDFTRDAKTAGAQSDVRLIRIGELEDESLGLREFRRAFSQAVQKGIGAPGVIGGAAREVARFASAREELQILRVVGRDSEETDFLSWLLSWLMRPEPRFASVVGEFGSGKTFSLLGACARLLGTSDTRPNDEGSLPLPVYVPLKSYRGRLTPGQVLDDLRSLLDPDGRRSAKVLHRVLDNGLLFLVFDGLDEVVHERSPDIVRDAVTALTSDVFGACRVLITSRAELFASRDEYESAFPEDGRAVPVGTLWSARPSFERLRILPWTPDEVASYLVYCL